MKTADWKPMQTSGQATKNLPEYAKRRLLTYADTLNELAKTMEGEFKAEPVLEETKRKDNSTYEGRGGVLQNRRIWESRQVVSSNLQQAANIMARAASEAFQVSPLEGKKKKMVTRALRAEGIVLVDLYYIERPGERTALVASMQLAQGDKNTGGYNSRDVLLVANLLSVILHKRLQVSVASPCRIEKEIHDFVFVEEAAFVVLSGTAKAVKEGEVLSGDNFSLIESEKGRITALLSDGMGSGEKACRDSERILDLMERLLESGCKVEEAMQMVNGILVSGSRQWNMPTLDVCDLDLYAGEAVFWKMGAAATFIKRGEQVETVSNHSLPMGIFQNMDQVPVHRNLTDGDYVIMMTDGVLEALQKNQYEETMCRIIRTVTEHNPREIAAKILQFALHLCGGSIQDDMTVLVLGMWENMKRPPQRTL